MEFTNNPNEQLTPVYDGEEITWIPVTEYYLRQLGKQASHDGPTKITDS